MPLAILVFATVTAVQPSALGCTTDSNHERWSLKTRPKPHSLASAKTVSLATMLGWPIPAGHDAAETTAIPPREPKLYTVSGLVLQIKVSGDRRHLPLGLENSGNPGGPRGT